MEKSKSRRIPSCKEIGPSSATMTFQRLKSEPSTHTTSQKLQQKNYQNVGVLCRQLGHYKTEVGDRVVNDNTQRLSSMSNTEKLSDNVLPAKGNYSCKAMTSSTTRCDSSTCTVQTGGQKQDHLTQYANAQFAGTTGGDQLLVKERSHTAHERQEGQNLNKKHAEK